MGLSGGPARTGSTPDQPPTRMDRGPPGGSEMLTGPMDRDFRPLRELLGALLRTSLVHVLFQDAFLLLILLLGSILSSQDDLPTFKIIDFS